MSPVLSGEFGLTSDKTLWSACGVCASLTGAHTGEQTAESSTDDTPKSLMEPTVTKGAEVT